MRPLLLTTSLLTCAQISQTSGSAAAQRAKNSTHPMRIVQQYSRIRKIKTHTNLSVKVTALVCVIISLFHYFIFPAELFVQMQQVAKGYETAFYKYKYM